MCRLCGSDAHLSCVTRDGAIQLLCLNCSRALGEVWLKQRPGS